MTNPTAEARSVRGSPVEELDWLGVEVEQGLGARAPGPPPPGPPVQTSVSDLEGWSHPINTPAPPRRVEAVKAAPTSY